MLLFVVGCGTDEGIPDEGDGITASTGGATAATRTKNSQNTQAAGGNESTSTRKVPATGGKSATATTASGGKSGTATTATGGRSSNDGSSASPKGGSNAETTSASAKGGNSSETTGTHRASGGSSSRGGSGPVGGVFGFGGKNTGVGGNTSTIATTKSATGGVTSTTGSTSTSTSTNSTTLDCNAAMPTGGQQHSGNGRGGKDNLAWEIWSNQGTGTMTTFSTPAFSASWNNSGDYLGRIGFEWGNAGKAYTSYGTITADYTFKKTGSGGGFSYIGIYGWSTNPCVEWYIVDDSFNAMPFTPWNSGAKGSGTIDGETYKFFSNSTNGTGGSRCNQSSWQQFWSIRQKARQCGTITISDHFKAWEAAGMKLGNLLEAKILVETGGGSGKVDFPIANVQKTQ